MNYIVAVSGGVDSVVLLDKLSKTADRLIVAHFDHGIREGSSDDAAFVGALAEVYGTTFELGTATLGPDASEELARNHRYDFLYDVAARHDARIVTAHHLDDMVESIAINLTRGTGWRGLAVMNRQDIERPLLSMTKGDIYEYALQNKLEWVEDETNLTNAYLRNRVRQHTMGLSNDIKQRLAELRDQQVVLSKEIQAEARGLVSSSRHVITMIDEDAAVELLREQLRKYGLGLPRPNLLRLLLAIKTARPGTVYQGGQGVEVSFTRRDFIVKHP